MNPSSLSRTEQESALTVSQLAERLKVSQTTIRRKLGTGGIPPHIRVGHSIRFPMAGILRFESEQ